MGGVYGVMGTAKGLVGGVNALACVTEADTLDEGERIHSPSINFSLKVLNNKTNVHRCTSQKVSRGQKEGMELDNPRW